MADAFKKRQVDAMIRRSRDMLAVASEHVSGEVEQVFAGVVCDGCGEKCVLIAPTKEALFSALPAALDGWMITDRAADADLCPKCSTQAAA